MQVQGQQEPGQQEQEPDGIPAETTAKGHA